MKKKLLSIILLIAPISIFAQFKVESSGDVISGSKLMNNGYWNIRFQSGITSCSGSNNAAIYGKAINNSGSVSYGVFGVAGSIYPYIQNKTFDINAYYDYSPLMVGYDVTTSEQYGDVTINPKSRLIINNGSNGVSIKNGFECKKRGQLIIQ